MLACGPRASLSHRSAAALHGLLRAGATPIEVTVAGGGIPGGRGINTHRTRRLLSADRVLVDAIPTTTIPRTLLDLAELVDRRTLSRAFEEADRLGVLQLDGLAEQYELANGRHHRRLFASVLAAHSAPPDVRSELERRFGELCEQDGIPPPSWNVLVAGHVVDCLWAAEKVVVELDGFAFHRTRGSHEQDHERDVDLALAGFRVLRFSWRQVSSQQQKVALAVKRELSGRARRRGA